MATKKVRYDKVGDWTVTTAMSLILRKGKKALYVGLTQSPKDRDLWIVLALESGAKDDMNGVLSNHAHDLVGCFPFAEAVRQAEDYARRWQPSGRACPCDEIPPAQVATMPTPRVRRSSRSSRVG